MSKKQKGQDNTRGAIGFDLYYQNIFGERWQGLKESLLCEPSPVAYCLTPVCDVVDSTTPGIAAAASDSASSLAAAASDSASSLVAAENPAVDSQPAALRTYYLDSASILAASCLPLGGAQEILDLCAAPGGKTLVLASMMNGDAHLTSNERSFERKMRLTKVCDEHMGSSLRARVTVTCSDGALWCKTKSECYDAILLDAPCSSERHVLNDEKYLLQWSPARIKTLSMEQWALLSSAYRMLKRGGYLLYSTCALAPDENDKVVSRLLKKFDDAVIVDINEKAALINSQKKLVALCSQNCILPNFEKTEYGYQILPDKQNGAGPIYFSLVSKI